MNDESLGVAKLISYLGEKKSLVIVIVALIIGVCLMLFGGRRDGDVPAVSTADFDTSLIEEKVEDLCGRVDGVGQVSVMITADAVAQKLYAKNSQFNSDYSKTEYVTVSGELLPTGEKAMTVRGVAIVCEGGDDVGVKLKLTELVCALFDIGADRVSVVGGK